MINSTSYGVHNTGQAFAPTPVSVNACSCKPRNAGKRKLLLLSILLLLCSVGNNALAFGTTYYYPVTATATGGGTYCMGATAADIAGSISTGSATATGGTSSTVNWFWYYNTTGATGTLAGATLAFTGASYTANVAAAVANLPGASISTAVPGTYYYFLYVDYTGGTAAPGTLYSGLTTVVVTDPGTISGATPVCVGASATLTPSTGSGAWSSGSPGIASVSGGVVTGVSQGTAVISYTIGVCSATTVETVYATPTPITGGLTACPGTTTSLSEFALGGTWASSTTSVASVSASGLVTGITAGTTTVDYTNMCGSASVVVTINPTPPSITGPSLVCSGGDHITLSDADPGGTWSSSTPSVATATTTGPNTGDIASVVPGTATITYTAAGTGCTTTRVVTVQPVPGPILGQLKACSGSAVTLSNAVPGGTWSSGTISVATIDPASGILVEATPGTSIITYTNSCGPTHAVYAVDTSLAIPANITSYGDSACVNTSTVFADVTLGGAWTSSNTSVATVLTGSGVITGVSTGTAVITYSIPPGCYTTRMVTINATPLAITGNSTAICPGTTVTLSDASTPGTWTSLRNFVATVTTTTGVVTGVSADTATIIFTTNKNCKTSTVVTVNPAPVPITGTNIPCGFSTDTVYDGTPGGLWSSSSTGVATIGAATGIITTHSGGTSVITYKLVATGCYATKVLTVNPAPVPLVTYNFVTNSFFTDTFYTSYQWYDDLEGAIPGAVSFRTAALYNGHYWVVVVDTNGCVGEGAHVLYNTAMTGVQNTAHIDDARIYPNPATNILHIESAVAVRAVITGIDGKTAMEQADAKEMNITALANGMYFISLYNDAGERVQVQKLIKQ